MSFYYHVKFNFKLITDWIFLQSSNGQFEVVQCNFSYGACATCFNNFNNNNVLEYCYSYTTSCIIRYFLLVFKNTIFNFNSIENLLIVEWFEYERRSNTFKNGTPGTRCILLLRYFDGKPFQRVKYRRKTNNNNTYNILYV